MSNAPRDHHYAPQFYLRNFASDPERQKITTVAKHGHVAVWAKRSIESVGFERDFYVHFQFGVPVSVETAINAGVETPISQSETWAKIASGRTDALDRSDKPLLYALMRHLEVRTPHYRATLRELANMAADPDSAMPFTDEERKMYAEMRADPDTAEAMLNAMSASVDWTEDTFRGCGLSVMRSPIPLRTSTTPVLVLPSVPDPKLRLPLPGMIPYQLVLPLSPNAIASLVLADFDDAFINQVIDLNIARAFNRNYAAQFSHFENVRHMIANRNDDLMADMTWAPYDLIEASERRIKFKRRERK